MADISYNALKSTNGVISEFTKELQKYILTPEEALNTSPASFINLHMSTLGKLSAYSFYEHLMQKKEINVSTAIRPKSLLRHLTSSEISEIYGKPSTLTFILSYSETEIINAAIENSTTGDSRLRLNKDFIMRILDKPQFTLDHDIEIIVSKYTYNGELVHSIYAKFDISDKNDDILSSIENPFIASRSGVIIRNEKYFTMFIPMRQYERSYSTVELNGEDNDQEIVFTDQLMGFMVKYKSPSDTSFRYITAYPDGEEAIDGPNYSINTIGDNNTLQLTFSKIPSYFSPSTGTLQIIIYTTKGSEGNFNFSLMDDDIVNGLDAEFYQDRSDLYQEALITLIPVASVKSTFASGGKDALTLDEIRNLIINKTGTTIITPGEIDKKVQEFGYMTYKTRHDVESFEYKVSGFVKDSTGIIIPTALVNFVYNYTDIPINTNINSRIITPRQIFRKENNDFVYLKDNIDSYREYITKYENNSVSDMVSPFFLKISTGSELNIIPYDMSLDKTYVAEFEFINDIILDVMSILDLRVYRNALDTLVKYTDSNGVDHIIGDFYTFEFVVSTSDVIITHLSSLQSWEKPYVKFSITLKNTTDTAEYIAECKLEDIEINPDDNTLICRVYIETDNAISDLNKINIINNSIIKLPHTSIPYQFYFIDLAVDVFINVLFLSSDTRPSTIYDSLLNPVDIQNNYYIGLIYSIKNIELVKDLSNVISMYPDVKLIQPSYAYATEDIPDTYSSVEYEVDENGKFKTEEVQITHIDESVSTINKVIILHNKGDIKKENDGRVGTYNFIDGIWSSQSLNTGIYNDGSFIGKSNAYCLVEYDGLIIFGGHNGRVSSYDTVSKSFYEYNTTSINRTSDSLKYIIKSNGEPMGNSSIRGMLVLDNTLIVYGDNGRIASCNLLQNKWRNYDGSGDIALTVYNNGSAMGEGNIYDAVIYKDNIIFAGSQSRVCSFNITSTIWYSYNSQTSGSIINSGTVLNNNAIYTLSLYTNDILFVAGNNGYIGSCNLTTKTWTNYNASVGIRSDGNIINGKNIFTSIINNGIYIVAGQDGYIASYDILRGVWSRYDQHGLSNNGTYLGGSTIYSITVYNTLIIFGGNEGRISSYNTTSLQWYAYNDIESPVRNSGEFILNTISAMIVYNSILFAAGRDGNIVYKYRIGDLIYDENNDPVINEQSKYVGYIKGVPAYNRIYAVKSKYIETLESYHEIINNIASITTYFADGCTLSLGVKTTDGQSQIFRFTNLDTKELIYLDNIALSFHIGVKFTDNTLENEKAYILTEIITDIINYVNNFNNTKFSISKMLDDIKNRTPNIEYFEHYKTNTYLSNICQTIEKTDIALISNTSTYVPVSEALTIKYTVDQTLSDINTGEIVFKPAITIDVLS